MIDNNMRQPYSAADSRSLNDTLLRLINTNLNINMVIQVKSEWNKQCLIGLLCLVISSGGWLE